MSMLSDVQPDTWFQMDSHPRVHSLPTRRGLVLAVIFPALDTTKEPLPPSMSRELVTTLTSLRKNHPKALIVGISSWGRQHERRFVDQHEGLCDILLGSGPGSGLTSTLSTHARTLWTRAFTKGRTVNKMTIKEFPSPNSSFHWQTGRNIAVKLVVLDDKIQNNPAMEAILAPLDTPAAHGKTSSCGQ
nr:hypothetical protein [Desulfoplanes formicivorans]